MSWSSSVGSIMNQNVEAVVQAATWERLASRAQAQDWPASALYVVATPIGNLLDLGLRAWQGLMRCDVIAAEDTRTSRTLLDAWGIDVPLMAAHRHNEAAAAEWIIARLQAGDRVGLISDAGAPAVSDPGGRIVRAVRAAGFRVVPIPGPSAVITALMASGVTSDENPGFAFAGFVPSRPGQRRQWLQQWCSLPVPAIMFETPHRLQATVADIAAVCGAQRPVTLARELTKRFEQIDTHSAAQMLQWLTDDTRRRQGEFVLIVHADPAADEETALDAGQIRLVDVLLESMSVRDVARIVARVSGHPRDQVYSEVLRRSGRSAS